MKQFATEANQKWCGAKLGAADFFFFFSTSSVLEKQDRGGEYRSVSDAHMKTAAAPEPTFSSLKAILQVADSFTSRSPNGSSAS